MGVSIRLDALGNQVQQGLLLARGQPELLFISLEAVLGIHWNSSFVPISYQQNLKVT